MSFVSILKGFFKHSIPDPVVETAEDIVHWLEEEVEPEVSEESILERENVPLFDKEELLHWLEEHENDSISEDKVAKSISGADYDEGFEHIGKPHDGWIPHSGRFPYGSGEHPGQHESWFKGFGKDAYDIAKQYDYNFGKYISDLKKTGLTESQIAKGLGISTKELKARVTLNKTEIMQKNKIQVNRILESNPDISNVEIGRILGINESTVRSIRKDSYGQTGAKLNELVDTLEKRVAEKGYIDVGEGSENWIGVKGSRLESAVNILKEKGYSVETIHVPQATNSTQNTSVKVLARPGETTGSIWKHYDEIAPIVDVPIDESGRGRLGLKYEPVSVDSKRIFVRYGDQGGADLDGLIELRRGVPDISLGKSKYAQVRIAVDGTHYMKGVAVYSDDIPKGYDIVYNTNRKTGSPLKLSDPDAKAVYKPMKINKETGKPDMDNPFGASIKQGVGDGGGQRTYIDPKTGEEKVSCINIVNDQGDWKNWRKSISSQFLSKQPAMVAEKQLKTALDMKKAEHDAIMSISNPVTRAYFLEQFAESCDSDAVDLKAAAFPRQGSHVLIPVPGIKDNECFCPRINDGEKVVLVRYPYAGTFEMPLLTVNNKNKKGISMIGLDSEDAVGISHKVAEQLSGADFDGDTVLVIPNNDGSIRTRKAFEDLVKFEPKEVYPGTKTLGPKRHRTEMGLVSNLITDMTIQGAPTEDIIKAVKHSMAVVDSKKHKIDVQQSYIDNEIGRLYKEYLGKARGGSSTIVSRASGRWDIPEREDGIIITDPKTGKKSRRYINPETGRKEYTETNRYYVKPKKYTDPETGETVYDNEGGKLVRAMTKTTKMAAAETPEEVRALMSNGGIGTPVERAYADFAIALKELGNQSRLEWTKIEMPKVNHAAAESYAPEVASLRKKVAALKTNAPLERQAQIFARVTIEAKKRIFPELNYEENKDDLKKVRNQAIASARNHFKTQRPEVDITPREWEAIEANAFPSTELKRLLRKANPDQIRHLAAPKTNRGLTSSQERLIRAMSRRGYSLAEIASQMGVSTSTVSNVINPKD